MSSMEWTVETIASVDAEIEALPVALRARLVRLLEAVENVGLEALRAPHVRHLEGKLSEPGQGRRRHRSGNLRDGDWPASGGSARLREEVSQDAAPRARDGQGTGEAGDTMTKLKQLKNRFMEDPEFREEYARADEEYALVEALVRARTTAKLTQAEVARRLGTTQSAIARLEGGQVSPSFATLRRYAEATGTRLTVGLERING
jgi:DNA-binding XRE family transcriptional regulator